MPAKELNFITGNLNKLAEVKAILGDTVALSSKSVDLPEIQGTIEEIALDKCRRAADIVGNQPQFICYNSRTKSYEAKVIAKVGGPVLIEDTALCFNALKGLPGPYIKWFLESLGHDGLNKLLFAYKDKSAQAVCTFAYCEEPGHEPIVFEGRVSVSPFQPVERGAADVLKGIIVPARGPPHFGWDAIFECEGETYAEMEPGKKNGLSHRYLALEKMKDWFIGRME